MGSLLKAFYHVASFTHSHTQSVLLKETSKLSMEEPSFKPVTTTFRLPESCCPQTIQMGFHRTEARSIVGQIDEVYCQKDRGAEPL